MDQARIDVCLGFIKFCFNILTLKGKVYLTIAELDGAIKSLEVFEKQLGLKLDSKVRPKLEDNLALIKEKLWD